MRAQSILILLALVVTFSAQAQKKMDLDDLEIKGELLGDNRLLMLNREKNKLRNFVEFRTNYRSEMVEGLVAPLPQYRDAPLSKLNSGTPTGKPLAPRE